MTMHQVVVTVVYNILIALNLRTCIAFSAVASLPSPTLTPPRIKDTTVAVNGKSTATITSNTTTTSSSPSLKHTGEIFSHSTSLTNYMRLPVKQYVLIPMPLGSNLTRVESSHYHHVHDEDVQVDISPLSTISSSSSSAAAAAISIDSSTRAEHFELVVPNITFFKLNIQPVVYATVSPQPNQVIISSTKCILRGSPFIKKVQLNDRFDFRVTTKLTWEDNECYNQSTTQNTEQHPNNIPISSLKNDVLGELSSITAETSIHINVDVPRPFNSIPKRILEATGNTAVKLSLMYIQANFVNNLAKDYVKWATTSEYRKLRASLAQEFNEENGE